MAASSAFAGGDPLVPGSVRAAAAGGYPSLAGSWWTWATGIFPDTPILDETGELCGQGQRGRVWFLAGNFGGTTVRDCRVPGGKTLFFPILNTLWWAPEDGDTAEELRAIANSQIEVEGVELGVTVDGEDVGDLFAYRAQSPPDGFAYLIAEGSAANALFGFDPGLRDPAVSDGYWMMLSPLGGGDHVVTIHARIPDAGGPGVDFEVDVTYNLSVRDD
jgi:hypothetical protein